MSETFSIRAKETRNLGDFNSKSVEVSSEGLDPYGDIPAQMEAHRSAYVVAGYVIDGAIEEMFAGFVNTGGPAPEMFQDIAEDVGKMKKIMMQQQLKIKALEEKLADG